MQRQIACPQNSGCHEFGAQAALPDSEGSAAAEGESLGTAEGSLTGEGSPAGHGHYLGGFRHPPGDFRAHSAHSLGVEQILPQLDLERGWEAEKDAAWRRSQSQCVLQCQITNGEGESHWLSLLQQVLSESSPTSPASIILWIASLISFAWSTNSGMSPSPVSFFM